MWPCYWLECVLLFCKVFSKWENSSKTSLHATVLLICAWWKAPVKLLVQLLEIALLGFWSTLCSYLQGCFYRIFRDYEVPTHLPLLLYFDGLIGLYDVSPDDYMNKYTVAKFDKIIRYVSNAKIPMLQILVQ